jgi:hypothetical protein
MRASLPPFLLLLSLALAQNATDAPDSPSGVNESEAAVIGRSLAESAAFAVITLVISIGFIVKGYFDTVYELAEAWPRTVAVVYLLSAWAFAVFMGGLALLVGPSDGVTLTPASLWYASTSLALGPFFVFTPIRPILLAKRSILRAAATFARKDSTRKTTFALFVVLTALQALVAYDMYTLLDSFGLPFEQVLLTVFGYALTAVFYLIVFYSSLLGRVFTIKNLDMVDHLRKNAFVHFRDRLHLLSGRFYAHFYVFIFVLVVAVQGVLGYLVVGASEDFRTGSRLRYTLFLTFLVAVCLFVIASVIFVLVAAFRPIKLRLAGTEEEREKEREKEVGSEETPSSSAALRDVKALHVTTPTEVRWCRFASHLTPTQRAQITDDIVSLLPSLSREPGTRSTINVRDGRVFQANPAKDIFHLLTAGRGLREEEGEEWLGFFGWEVQRGARVDGASAAAFSAGLASTYDAVFQRLLSAFAVPTEWERVREEILVAQAEADGEREGEREGEGEGEGEAGLLAGGLVDGSSSLSSSPPPPGRGGKRGDSDVRRSRRRTARLSSSLSLDGSNYDAKTMVLENGTIVGREREREREREVEREREEKSGGGIILI